MAGEERSRDREWTDVDRDLRSGYSTWSRKHGYRSADGEENVWDGMQDGVKHAWDKLRGRSTGRAVMGAAGYRVVGGATDSFGSATLAR